jgi:hypothetical protein
VTKQMLTHQHFTDLTRPLIGLTVSHTWRGHGSAIFLELGKLKPTRGGHHPKGQASLMLEWSWRIESPGSILAGSWSHERKLTNAVLALKGRKVAGLSLEGRLPELAVALTGGRWVHSFMTAEGQPEWTLFLPDGTWLCVERGRVLHDKQNKRRSR